MHTLSAVSGSRPDECTAQQAVNAPGGQCLRLLFNSSPVIHAVGGPETYARCITIAQLVEVVALGLRNESSGRGVCMLNSAEAAPFSLKVDRCIMTIAHQTSSTKLEDENKLQSTSCLLVGPGLFLSGLRVLVDTGQLSHQPGLTVSSSYTAHGHTLAYRYVYASLGRLCVLQPFCSDISDIVTRWK